MKKETMPSELSHILNGLYDTPLPPDDAEQAAHSLVGLFEVLLEIRNEGYARS